ncbi:hypothetical protein V5799_023229 [Amblyomma americanum]|uniref:Uncharacterized protein n=1 Tax=Amblyomma americanum TaxID=6943 RepID=A0AAQ4FIV9_AMBAM
MVPGRWVWTLDGRLHVRQASSHHYKRPVATHYEHGTPPGQNFSGGSLHASRHVTTVGTIEEKGHGTGNKSHVSIHCDRGFMGRSLLNRLTEGVLTHFSPR